MTEQNRLDTVLTIIGNPVRRAIIKRLSQEPSYALELAKEIGAGQQLVTTHLSIMEKNGIVSSKIMKSPIGPMRRLYFLNQSACVSVSFGPHLYQEHFATFDTLPPKLSEDAKLLLKRAAEMEEPGQDGNIEAIWSLLRDIDEKLMEVEREKAVLQHIRNRVMELTSGVMAKQEKTHDERRILHYLLDTRSANVEDISKALNLHESVIRNMLEKVGYPVPNGGVAEGAAGGLKTAAASQKRGAAH